jgi:PilZ domain
MDQPRCGRVPGYRAPRYALSAPFSLPKYYYFLLKFRTPILLFPGDAAVRIMASWRPRLWGVGLPFWGSNGRGHRYSATPIAVGISEGEMSAMNRASASVVESLSPKASTEPRCSAAAIRPAVLQPQSIPTPAKVPALRVLPLVTDSQPRRFIRVPTHAVGVHPEHREYPRASLRLPIRLRSVGHVAEDFPITLVTRDISSTGVYFLCPKPVHLGIKIELEIVLVSRPMGRGNVVVASTARVQRVEPAATPGWFGIAATFDDVAFGRDDRIPSRFLNP